MRSRPVSAAKNDEIRPLSEGNGQFGTSTFQRSVSSVLKPGTPLDMGCVQALLAELSSLKKAGGIVAAQCPEASNIISLVS